MGEVIRSGWQTLRYWHDTRIHAIRVEAGFEADAGVSLPQKRRIWGCDLKVHLASGHQKLVRGVHTSGGPINSYR
jgi:hypothetical protein